MVLLYNISHKDVRFMKHKLMNLSIKFKSLAVFRNLYSQPIFITLQHLLAKSQGNHVVDCIDSIAEFASVIYEQGGNLSDIVFTLCMEDENAYVIQSAEGKKITSSMQSSLRRELLILEEISQLTLEDIISDCGIADYIKLLPSWEIKSYDFQSEYEKRLKNINRCGYGIYAKYHMFYLLEDTITPIAYPDTQRLSDFSDYERERSLVVKNTEALLAGEKASNVLLYGDAGTGKSSTIKAIVNEFSGRGLRLLEVKKQQLYQIPKVVEELSKNPLKFILFIDDLSFSNNDENFAALKSILEGGVSALGNNVVIYATSNRRHLIKEDHQSRVGDEVHLNDTLQETMSLSSRFGLIITFNRPEKEVYLHIVSKLAQQYNVVMEESELFNKAEAYAIRHHGRSPRTAKQFIELLKAGI